MMRCAVCGATVGDVREWTTQGGARYGMACRGECAGLLWEAHFQGQTPDSDRDYAEFEAALMAWKWRRRRAEVEGVRFDVAAPESAVERISNLQQMMGGAL
jgi:hypothetical protein